MIQGGGSKEWPKVRAMAWGKPELFDAVIDLLVEQTIALLAAQIEAGAEAVMLFDSWAGILAPALFRAHVIAPTARIVAALRGRYPAVPVIGFPRQSGMLMLEYVRATGVQGVGMDTSIDAALAARKVPPGVAIQGNLDPELLVTGGKRMAHEVSELLEAVKGRPFIFNLGHGVVPQTPVEHVAELLALVRAAA
jgi:uroporphyrinogen decarboxylase